MQRVRSTQEIDDLRMYVQNMSGHLYRWEIEIAKVVSPKKAIIVARRGSFGNQKMRWEVKVTWWDRLLSVIFEEKTADINIKFNEKLAEAKAWVEDKNKEGR